MAPDQSFILRLLRDGKMDLDTLAIVAMSNRTHIQKVLEELEKMGLVEKHIEEGKVFYKATKER
ncbi:MAG: helix-turn-helix domain-containing protein [Candidatus Hydrothermarchaeales archaeon]